MARRTREFDWSQTPIGPIERWPQSLKTAVNLILNSQHPMWIGWGEKVTFLYNDAYIDVLSIAKHPWALGRPAAEVWSEIWDVCGPLVDKVFKKSEPSFFDDVRLFMNRGGFLEETYYSFSYSPIQDESGKTAGLFCPSAQVTAQVLSARRLRTLSELSANALVEKTVEGACFSASYALSRNPDDIPFAFLYLNTPGRRGMQLQFQNGLSELAAKTIPVSVDIGEEIVQSGPWPISEVANAGRSRVFSVSGTSSLPSGPAQQPVVEAIALPVKSPGEDRPTGVLVAAVNPTRKLDAEYTTFYELIAGHVGTAIANARAYEEERRRAESLAELDRAKTTFFSNISHELRTPLALVLGPTEAALTSPTRSLAGDELEMVHRNELRLLKLVNTLLDFSRIEAGRVQANFEATDLAVLTAELASVFRAATERAGLNLTIDCPPLLHPVLVDREMWEKIVFNLISNAFKSTFAGEIAISLKERGDQVQLEVRDTGTGIAREQIPHLFERFRRIEGARRRSHEGSGIGLALVHELVKLHHGSIKVKSELGKGTTFTVSVPAACAAADNARITARNADAVSRPMAAPYVAEALSWLQGQNAEGLAQSPHELLDLTIAGVPKASSAGRVLLVDDNPDMRDYVRRLLAGRFTVFTAENGKTALTMLKATPPDVIISDVMMPEMDGLELLAALRSDPNTNTIPVIRLSARAGDEARIEGVQQGADDYLVKPFSARELLARVQTHIDLARLRKEAVDAVRSSEEELRILQRVGSTLASELDLKKLVQVVTDAGRELSEAEFGAFFYNVVDGSGEKYTLYTLSGAPEEAFSRFPMPRNTAVFAPTFAGEQTVRIDDVKKDPRYGKSAPHYGMPAGHLPVRSYLAVPVMSRAGEVLGGLFYGHSRPGVFSEKAERLVQGISRQAAIAIDNANLFRAVKEQKLELQDREEQLRAIIETTPECVKIVAADGIVRLMNDHGLKMIGLDSPDEVIGKSVYDFIAPEDRTRFREFNQRVCAGESGVLEFAIVGARGERKLMETHAAPLRTPDGQTVQLAVARDISQRKLAEATTGRLAAIVESSDDAIISKNLDGIITSWNQSAERMFGYSAAEAVAKISR